MYRIIYLLVLILFISCNKADRCVIQYIELLDGKSVYVTEAIYNDNTVVYFFDDLDSIIIYKRLRLGRIEQANYLLDKY